MHYGARDLINANAIKELVMIPGTHINESAVVNNGKLAGICQHLKDKASRYQRAVSISSLRIANTSSVSLRRLADTERSRQHLAISNATFTPTSSQFIAPGANNKTYMNNDFLINGADLLFGFTTNGGHVADETAEAEYVKKLDPPTVMGNLTGIYGKKL